MTNQNITFTMKFDASDLAKLAGQITAALTGGYATYAGRSGQPAGGTPASGGGTTTTQAAAQQNIFAQILKALSVFEGLKTAWNIIVRNSTVANTYLGAMGKVFGAAMDMLLIPFIPVFNLIMVGLGKLVEWLSRDDIQKTLSKLGEFLAAQLESLASRLATIWVNNIWPTLQYIYASGIVIGQKVIEVANWLGLIHASFGSLARDIAIAIVAAKGAGIAGAAASGAATAGGAAVASGGGFLGAGLLGGLVAGISRLPLAAMIVGGIEGAFSGKQSTHGNNATGNRIMNIIRGAGTMGGILPDWPHELYKLVGQQDPRDLANKPKGFVPNNTVGTEASNIPVNANVYINVQGQQDPAKFAQMVKDEVDKIVRTANR